MRHDQRGRARRQSPAIAWNTARAARAAADGNDGGADELRSVARLAAALDARAEASRAAALELLEALERVLRG